MDSKIVSVIIPCMEQNNMLKNTIESILNQRNFDILASGEIIIVDCSGKDVCNGLDAILTNYKGIVSTTTKLSEACSLGLAESSGKYISYINCGDTISSDYFPACLVQLKQNENIPFVSMKSRCVNPTLLDIKSSLLNSTKYESTGLIDIRSTPELFHCSLFSAVFKREILMEQPFNKEIVYEFDHNYVIRLLLKHPVYGVCQYGCYDYFMPQEDNFSYYIPSNHKEWYTENLKDVLLPLINESKKDGKVPSIVQVYIMYLLQSKFLCNMNNRNKKTMTDDELKKFINVTSQVLQNIEDRFILDKDRYKIFAFSMEASKMFIQIKYGIDNACPLNYVEGKEEIYLNFNQIEMMTMSSQRAAMHIMDYQNGHLVIDGSFREVFNTADLKLFATFNGKKYYLTNNDRYSLTKYFGISAYKKFTFHLKLPLNEELNEQKLEFFAKIKSTVVPVNISFIHHWSKLTTNPTGCYWRFNKYIATHEDKAIVIRHASALDTFRKEIAFLPKVFAQSKRSFITRIMYWLTKPFFAHKKIWLMYDKMYKGGDSSEYLYRYCKNKKDGVTRYYVIDKNTSDYRQLKADGFKPVVNKSWKHKMIFLNADIALITNSNVFPFNGYSIDRSRFIRGLCNFSSMCLQHGLSVQKCAMAQQRIVDHTRMYFLGSKYEVGNLSHHAYNYEGFDVLRLTGIGRYDGLVNNDQKQILLSPTWRMYNAMPVTTSEGEQRQYNPEFKNTVYFKIYNDLINNEKLIATAKKTGYKIKYLLHPILSAQVNDYTPNSEVEVISSVGDLSYEKILTESSLMVTDYSGVQFDFAYMKKPLVYFHPSMLPAHYEDGCFFYDTMGFGEICTESDQLVNTLCAYMEAGCKMKDKYVKRVEDFYAHDDHNNCERIYNEIITFQNQLDKDKGRKQ